MTYSREVLGIASCVCIVEASRSFYATLLFLFPVHISGQDKDNARTYTGTWLDLALGGLESRTRLRRTFLTNGHPVQGISVSRGNVQDEVIFHCCLPKFHDPSYPYLCSSSPFARIGLKEETINHDWTGQIPS